MHEPEILSQAEVQLYSVHVESFRTLLQTLIISAEDLLQPRSLSDVFCSHTQTGCVPGTAQVHALPALHITEIVGYELK